MKLKYATILLICPLAASLWARPKTDVLVMNNGDRITCEIKKLERGVKRRTTSGRRWSTVSVRV